MKCVIAAQLTTQIEGYEEYLSVIETEDLNRINPSKLFYKIIFNPLKSLNSEIQTIIVIDGLDEAFSVSSQNIIMILNEYIEELPQGVKLILSSRKVPEIIDVFAEFKIFDLSEQRELNIIIFIQRNNWKWFYNKELR